MASEALTVPKNDISSFLPGLNLSKVTSTQEYLFTSDELNDILGALKTRLTAEINMVESDFAQHVAMILLRTFFVTTSPKAKFTGKITYEITSGGATTKYELKDSFIFPAIQEAGKKYGKSNTLRAWASSLQDCFIAMAKKNPETFECKSATRKGAPVGYAYLTADFLTGESTLLDNHERAIMNQAANYALNKISGANSERELVSLYDYGK
nr:minor coat protein [wheat closterovirus 1]